MIRSVAQKRWRELCDLLQSTWTGSYKQEKTHRVSQNWTSQQAAISVTHSQLNHRDHEHPIRPVSVHQPLEHERCRIKPRPAATRMEAFRTPVCSPVYPAHPSPLWFSPCSEFVYFDWTSLIFLIHRFSSALHLADFLIRHIRLSRFCLLVFLFPLLTSVGMYVLFLFV